MLDKANRLLVGNIIIAIGAIVKADYNPASRKLTIFLVDKQEVNLRGDEAESTWDYLRAGIYGCIEPLPIWKVNSRNSNEVRSYSS